MACLADLVTPEKLQLFQYGAWALAPEDSRKIPLSVFEDSAKEMVLRQGEILGKVDAEQILHYIDLFNTAWTAARLAQRKISAPPKTNAAPIQFSSFSRQYAWLSNFFHTLVFDRHKMRILPHVEAGYVAFKAEVAGESEFARKIIQEFDPAEAKACASHLERPDGALSEMQRLEVLKFTQNSVLKALLIKSGEVPLEEHTSDPFWGTTHGAVYGENSNHLGRILEAVRTELSD